MKKVLLILGAVLLGIVLVIGGCKVQEKSQKEQMLEIVKSDEVKELVEQGLKNLDSNSLTDSGIIKTYKIDYNSVKHNPMGGIMITTYVNNDKTLFIKDTINKDSSTGKLKIGGSAISKNLSQLLKGDK
ncbi:DUF1310 family protein [Streptococcus intermedius]|uniref:DUF1310 family protein n=1 Tax=Streptococcus intermedius TaxID=1338 RepID=UPI00023297F2|nr:DUF1310 family protein [Streptococcus intermedius]EHG12146.1 hypothetical protein HMPREF9177_01144 [Streptococcus intermedius F0413]QKH77106.1 DUF1310 family protein [Streptococcus intermedius]